MHGRTVEQKYIGPSRWDILRDIVARHPKMIIFGSGDIWNADDIFASDATIVIEVAGGIRPAYDWVKAALQSGKSVVTANKQLMAHHGAELLDIARSKGLEVRFEASVAGGIPVLRALQEGLAGDRLVEVRGILNGTCNYILTNMAVEAGGFVFAFAEQIYLFLTQPLVRAYAIYAHVAGSTGGSARGPAAAAVIVTSPAPTATAPAEARRARRFVRRPSMFRCRQRLPTRRTPF